MIQAGKCLDFCDAYLYVYVSGMSEETTGPNKALDLRIYLNS